MVHRLLLLALLAAPRLAAQTTLVPVEREPYRTKVDVSVADAHFLLAPETPTRATVGGLRFRFLQPSLDSLLRPPTVLYVASREGGFHVQVLHLRSLPLPREALGPQPFVVEDSAGVLGTGTLLVAGEAPEAVDLAPVGGARFLELGRATPVELLVRSHGNYAGGVRVRNPRAFALTDVDAGEPDSAGLVRLRGRLRPLRSDPGELRLGVETLDGRVVDLVFPPISVRVPTPRRVALTGGPVYLDVAGRGTAQVTIDGFPADAGTPELDATAAPDVRVIDQRFDPAARRLIATVEVGTATGRAAGTRETRELAIRADEQLFRAVLELVGPPAVASVKADATGRAAMLIGATATRIRITGQNLDGYRLDCASLGGGTCRTVRAAPAELLVEVHAPAGTTEGEHLLPLVRDSGGGGAAAFVRVQAEHAAVPVRLGRAEFLEVSCAEGARCRRGRDGESMVVPAAQVQRLTLRVDPARIPAANGWQKVVVTVTRVRGDQRQVVRTSGSAGAPRLFRNGIAAGEIALVDASADARHGDLFLVRVEHATEQYPLEHRAGVEAADAFVRRVYVDAGLSRRIIGDVVVQPVLLAFGEKIEPLYPNAGVGITWQRYDERMEPRAFSTKLQLLATNLSGKGETGAAEPALFLSGNVRIPGPDPNRPLVLTTGVARMLGDEGRWRFLAGAGMDLGVARMIFD